MNKRILFGLCLIIVNMPIYSLGQKIDTLSIEYCYSRALKAYPLLKDKHLIREAGDLKVENLKKRYLPQMDISGDAKYLSEVINLNAALPIPGYDIPSPPNDQYNIVFGLNQIVYDGGFIRWKKELEKATAQVDDQALNVELYKLKDQVNKLFFSILFLQVNDSLFRLSGEELDERVRQVSSAVNNGSMLLSELDVLKAENINLEQQILENEYNIRAIIASLEVVLDTVIDPGVVLQIPTVVLDFDTPINRPEHILFAYQNEKLELNKQIVSTTLRPKFMGFGQAGYGQPGLNPVNEGFDPYFVVGVKMQWNFWDWNTVKREKKVISLQQARIENQKETFDHNLNIGLNKSKEEVNKLEEVLKKDEEIIELRRSIMKTTSSKLDNGVIQSADYIRDFNKYLVSLVTQNLHSLQLLQAKFDYLTLNGNTIGDEN